MANKLYAHIILDRSGSMEDGRANTIGAVNEYLGGLSADADLKARVSLSLFDCAGMGSGLQLDALYSNVKAKDAPKLTTENYVPRGGTPLYDAIGAVVAEIDKQERRDNERIALVIVTDGEENSSKEHTRDSIRALLDARRQDKNWLVIYLGADHNAFTEASKIGLSVANTMTFNKRDLTANTASLRASSRATRAYASAASAGEGLTSSAFTDTERDLANKK